MRVQKNTEGGAVHDFAGGAVKVVSVPGSGRSQIHFGLPPMDSRWGEICGWHKDGQDIRDKFGELVDLLKKIQRHSGLNKKLRDDRDDLVMRIAAFSTERVPADADSRRAASRYIDGFFREADRIIRGANRELDVRAVNPQTRPGNSSALPVLPEPAPMGETLAEGDTGAEAPRARRTSRQPAAAQEAAAPRGNASQRPVNQVPMDEAAIRLAIETALDLAQGRGGQLRPYSQRMLAAAICAAFGGEDKSHIPHHGTYDSDANVQHVIRNLHRVLTPPQRESLNALLARHFDGHGFFA